MDTPAQNQTIAGATPASKSSGVSKLLILVTVFAIGLILGILGDKYFSASLKKTQDKQIAESNLPVSLELLTNPIIYEWRGSVEGELVAKSESAITLKDNSGNTLTVPLTITPGRKSSTYFYDSTEESTESGQVNRPIAIDEINIGDYLRGDFFVVKGTKDRLIGSSFAKVKKPE